MRPLSECLTALIREADVLIRQPQQVRHTPAFAALAAEIRDWERRPAEGVRCTRAALVMLHAIEGYFETGGEKGNPWLMLAGATLPLLRVDAWLALNDERNASQETRR